MMNFTQDDDGQDCFLDHSGAALGRFYCGRCGTSYRNGSDDEIRQLESIPKGIPETAGWLSAAIGSGIAGNAAYDLVKVGYKRGRDWWLLRHKRRRREPLTENEAFALARAAIATRCEALGVDRPAALDFYHSAYNDRSGRWFLILCDKKRRKFYIQIPGGRPRQQDLAVDIQSDDRRLR